MTQETNQSYTQRNEVTRLTEPVQVGLWYQTKAGCYTKIDNVVEDCIFEANNGHGYNSKGENFYKNTDTHDLVKCLGADPFNQVKPTTEKTSAVTTLHTQVAVAALQGLLANRHVELSHYGDVVECMTYADEFIKQKNGRENG